MKAVSVALFAGMIVCASVQLLWAVDADASTERVLYSFCSQQNCTDGETPFAGLIDVHGIVYGTTVGGGKHRSTMCTSGCGTVFSLDPSSGAETVLYSFCKKNDCADGASPTGSLIAVHGILYGTTGWGGKHSSTICTSGCGTVFSLDPGSGLEKVLYSFCRQDNCADGAYPFASLINVNGLLYGTTQLGGATGCDGYGCGTVFSIDPNTRTQKVLYSFCSQANCVDGQWPLASLIASKGTLYGTTTRGGLTGCGENLSTCGTVFAIDLSTDNEKVLYSFCSQANCTDGAVPFAGLIDVKGMLFGTTQFGGVYACQNPPPGCGTVFALDASTDAESVLHSFGRGLDGFDPNAGLVDAKGTLYGTSSVGGSYHSGTAFALDMATGTETVLWSFCGQQYCADGAFPFAGLIDMNGKLYGTTQDGGTGAGCVSPGCGGTVFVLEKR